MLKRWISVILAAIMLLSTLTACGTPSENTDDTTKAPADSGAVEDETKETLDVPLEKYNREFTILDRDEKEWSSVEIFAEANSTDNISKAVFERNDRILQDYGVTVKELKYNTDEHINMVSKEVSAPTKEFQAVVSQTGVSTSMASQNYLWNLHSDEIEYLDLSKSWWDQNMVEGLSIENNLFCATGDLLTLDNDATFVILFNKALTTACHIPDLYEMVDNKEWTMAKFYEFAKLSKQDKDGDGKLSYNTDVSGFGWTDDAPYCFLFAGGITLSKKDENDSLIYELNVDRAQDIVDMGKLIFSNDHAVNLNSYMGPTGLGLMEIGKTCFGEGHTMFFAEVMQSVTRMRNYDVDFGILPFPMFDKYQGDYCSMMHLTAAMVSIPRSVVGNDLEMASAMLEAMAYHSVDTLTEQYYEINLKTKGAKDEKSGPMIDKILASRACDLVYYYGFGENAFGKLAGCLRPDATSSVSSTSKKFASSIGRDIRALTNQVLEFDE